MRVALLALVACGSAVPMPTAPSFAVVDYGAEPRNLVRHETAPDASERIAITYKVRTSTKYENTVMEEGRTGADFPGIRSIASLTATAVSPAGDADVQVVIEEASVLDDVVDPRSRATMTTVADGLRGKRAQWSRAASGEISTARRVDGLEEVLRASGIVFPREPIGIGARWSETLRIVIDNVPWWRTTTYTLRDRTDDAVTIDLTTELRAGEQALHAEPNATTRLKGGSGRGTGHLVIPLRGLGLRGKVEEARTLDVLITRGRDRIEAAITAEVFLSYDAP